MAQSSRIIQITSIRHRGDGYFTREGQNITYDRLYTSLDEFIRDHKEACDELFGSENWSATKVSESD